MDLQETRPSLLSRVRDSADHEAWRAFDHRYRDLILNYCRRCGVQEADAEDIRQLVMLNLSKSLRNFEYDPAKGRFRNYLGRVARNAVHRYMGQRSGEARLETTTRDVLADADRDDIWLDEWVQHHYRRAMDHVRGHHQARTMQIFERLLETESLATVAAEFEVSTESVRKIRSRIRDQLKTHIAAQIREEDRPQ